MLDGLEQLHGIIYVHGAESKVEVDAGAGVVGLGHSTRDHEECDAALTALLVGG